MSGVRCEVSGVRCHILLLDIMLATMEYLHFKDVKELKLGGNMLRSKQQELWREVRYWVSVQHINHKECLKQLPQIQVELSKAVMVKLSLLDNHYCPRIGPQT